MSNVLMAHSRTVTSEELDRFFDFVGEGYDRRSAAKAVREDLSGSVFRSLISRDPGLQARWAEALERGGSELADGGREEIRRRVLVDRDATDRLLQFFLAAHCPEYAFFWQKRDGAGGAPEVLGASGGGDASRLTEAQHEHFTWLAKIYYGLLPNPELEREALAAGDGEVA